MEHSDGRPSGPLDLNLLRTFLAVYRSGSFTGAAQLLGLSQPTVTTQMRALERQLGASSSNGCRAASRRRRRRRAGGP